MPNDEDAFWGGTPDGETTAPESQTPEEETPDDEPSEEAPETKTATSEGEPESESEKAPEKPKDDAAHWQTKFQEERELTKKLRAERALGMRGVHAEKKPEEGEAKPDDTEKFYDDPLGAIEERVRNVMAEERSRDYHEKWVKERDEAFGELHKWAEKNDCVEELATVAEDVANRMIQPSGAWPLKRDGTAWTPQEQVAFIRKLTIAELAPEAAKAAAENAKAEAEARHEKKLSKTTPPSEGGGMPVQTRQKTAEEEEVENILNIGSQSPEARQFFGK